MTETGEQPKPAPKKRFTRRQVLLGGTLGAAAVGIAAVLPELTIFKEGIETADGIFTPLYEAHSLGLKESDIPKDANVFFKEFIINKSELSAKELFTLKNQFGDGFLPQSLLARLSQQKTEIMLGDVVVPYFTEALLLQVAETIGGAGLAYYGLQNWPEDNKISRRKLLKIASILGGAWGVSKFLSYFISPLTAIPDAAVKRITARLLAMPANLHPEDPLVFFRSLVMANNMMEVAKDFRQKTGEKAKIAFDVGAAHGNIEDFLLAGQDFCRVLISRHPKFFLSKVVKQNGGITAFCTSRLFKLPTDLRAEDLDQSPKLESAAEREVTDHILAKRLKNILHSASL